MPMKEPRSRPAVVINADDLGKSPSVNQAILASFERGLISSATVMANMPGFRDACAAVVEHEIQDRIGVHLNLSEGEPLSDRIRGQARLCSPEGLLGPAIDTRWRLTRDEETAVEIELAAQIDALLDLGITPSHLDSHHHVHTRWPFTSIVLRLARRYGVRAVRLSRNCGPSLGPAKGLYKVAANARIARAGLALTRHFGSARDAASLTRFDGPVEIMVHPGIDGEGRLVDLTSAGLLEAVTEPWRTTGRLVSYRGLHDHDPTASGRR